MAKDVTDMEKYWSFTGWISLHCESMGELVHQASEKYHCQSFLFLS